jgi:hypothetical protein
VVEEVERLGLAVSIAGALPAIDVEEIHLICWLAIESKPVAVGEPT